MRRARIVQELWYEGRRFGFCGTLSYSARRCTRARCTFSSGVHAALFLEES
ncbi:hypothetical protein TPSea814_000353a [Treponema pallidum subsp. pallidum str. Sea 81-4]|nr:hypothetical protein TPSea814_000353a [Treponema pallidum subsp. pallidum str. Sea 81-4]